MSFWKEAPPPEQVLTMEPEELAPFLLRYLQKQPPNRINRYNFSLVNDGDLVQALGGRHASAQEYASRLMEAWMYLERQGFLAPAPGQQGEWMFVTRRGMQVVDDQDFEAYKQEYLLQSSALDPILVQKAKQSFVRGDYDTAVFQAFREVEIRVRKKASLSDSDVGASLMRKAFGPKGGPLTDTAADPGEQVGRMELFAGAMGAYRNPSGHRDHITDPKEAADLIHFANQLLRVVNRLS